MQTKELRDLFKTHPYLVSSLALASALAFFFAVRFLTGIVYWSAHQEERVQAWMTVGYIGRSWDLNPRLIDDTAGLPKPVAGHPFTLSEIARQRGVPVEEVIAQVEATLAELKAHHK